MLGEIECIRELLNKELENENSDYKKILEMSQELDELIVEYCNQKIMPERENE